MTDEAKAHGERVIPPDDMAHHLAESELHDEHFEEDHHEVHARRARLALILRSRDSIPWIRLCGSSLIMVLVIAIVLALGALWRLTSGPISAPFLTERALREIGARLPPGFGVDLADVAVQKTDAGLVLDLNDMTLRDKLGGPLATAGRIRIIVDAMPLLMGRVNARSITVENASAALEIGKDGRLTIKAGQNGTDIPAPVAPAASLAAMFGALDGLLDAAGSLETVELSGARLSIDDKAFGRKLDYRDISLAVQRTDQTGGLSLMIGGQGGGKIEARIDPLADGGRSLALQGHAVSAADLVLAFMPGSPPPDLSATINGDGKARIAADGTISAAALRLSVGAGSWRMAPDVAPFAFDSAALDIRWDSERHAVIVDRAMLTAGEGTGVFQGQAVPPTEQSPDWLISLDAPGMMIAGAGSNDEPLKLETASIRARFNSSTRILGIDSGKFVGPAASLAMSGSVAFGGKSPGIGLGVAGSRMSVTALKRFWPFFALPETRDWFDRSVTVGTVDSISIGLAIPQGALVSVNGKIPPLPDKALTGDIAFEDASARVIDTLPPLTGLNASAHFSGRHFKLSTTAGRIDMGDASLHLGNGTYELPDLGIDPPTQQIDFNAKGDARALARLMVTPPLSGAATGLDIKPEGIAGTADLQVDLALPLMKAPAMADVSYSISGKLENLALQDFNGLKLTDGDLDLALEQGRFSLKGKVDVGGLPASIDVDRTGDEAPAVGLSFNLDDAARAKLGLDFGDALSGSVTAKVMSLGGNGASASYNVALDLSAARIRDLIPGWQKPPGRPGKASFVWRPEDIGGDVKDLVLESGPVSIRGDLSLGHGNTLQRAVLKSVKISPGDDAQGTIDAAADGWKVNIKGKAFDMRPTLLMLQRKGAATSDLSADIAIDRVLGFGDETLSGFALGLQVKDGAITRFKTQGVLGDAPFSGTLESADSGSLQVGVQSGDAGALLRFLNYYSHVVGGSLSAAFTPTIGQTSGQIFMREFSVENEAAIGQYLASVRRSSAASNNPDAGDVTGDKDSARFSKLRLDLTRASDKLSIREAVIWGPDVGANLSGNVDYASNKVNLTGTFVPAYALNNMFSHIPVFGALLGGNQYEGLFAVTFKVSGSIEAPVLTFNPLSAIAPGFLRKIFEFQKDDG